jgi:hypothetical protein
VEATRKQAWLRSGWFRLAHRGDVVHEIAM